MVRGYYYREPDDSYHYVMPNIDRFSHFYLTTKQNKEEKLDQNLKKSPKCKPIEMIKQNKKTSILLGAIGLLALVSIVVASKRK
jgi:uncharacterized membrane protein YkgB